MIKIKKTKNSSGIYILDNDKIAFSSAGIIRYPFVKTIANTNFRQKLFHIGYIGYGIFIARFLFFAVQFDIYYFFKSPISHRFFDEIHNFFATIQRGFENA